jgi:acetylornithine deacetylase/succinyl-diaminopimelate desuccinylase-like protein
VGSRRYRITFKGPGGHSYGSFGAANPIHALGRAIGAIAEFQVPVTPPTTFNVGRIGGGTSVNSIASEAWMEVDLRSADTSALKALDARFQKAIEEALVEENKAARSGGRLAMVKEVVGDRPAGQLDVTAPIVAAAASVTEALGLAVSFDEASTDANLPMSINIPAIRIEGGGKGSGSHSLDESFDATDSWQGTARAALLAIALTNP